MSHHASTPRPWRRAAPRAAFALVVAGLLSSPPSVSARGRFSRTLASGHVDFRRQVAVARGVGPRAVDGEPDRASAMARTNLKALLLPHPVDGEVTLGDLAAYHPDLATALEFQVAQAREQRRNALPPDLEEVVLELDLGDLIEVLLPFLGSDEAAAPASLAPIASPPSRVLLRLPTELATDHVPSLLPSLRGLGGVEAIPARGAWLRDAYAEPLVQYREEEPEAAEGDWEIRVVATGGLAGATLFLEDADAERLRRLLGGEEVPEILVVPGDLEARPTEEPTAPLAALDPPGERSLPPRYRGSVAARHDPIDVKVDVGRSSPARAPRPEEPPDFGGMLRDLRARLDEVRPLRGEDTPATPAEAIRAASPQEGRMPPEVLEALPEDAFADRDDGKLYGAVPAAPEPAPPAAAPPAGSTWQEFGRPEDPDGILWESFDSSLSNR